MSSFLEIVPSKETQHIEDKYTRDTNEDVFLKNEFDKKLLNKHFRHMFMLFDLVAFLQRLFKNNEELEISRVAEFIIANCSSKTLSENIEHRVVDKSDHPQLVEKETAVNSKVTKKSKMTNVIFFELFEPLLYKAFLVLSEKESFEASEVIVYDSEMMKQALNFNTAINFNLLIGTLSLQIPETRNLYKSIKTLMSEEKLLFDIQTSSLDTTMTSELE